MDEDLEILFFQMAAWEFSQFLRPDPWEWKVSTYWEILTPNTQELLQRFAVEAGMELHVFGPTLAIIYNPQRPSRWELLKRMLHDTFRSRTSES